MLFQNSGAAAVIHWSKQAFLQNLSHQTARLHASNKNIGCSSLLVWCPSDNHGFLPGNWAGLIEKAYDLCFACWNSVYVIANFCFNLCYIHGPIMKSIFCSERLICYWSRRTTCVDLYYVLFVWTSQSWYFWCFNC